MSYLANRISAAICAAIVVSIVSVPIVTMPQTEAAPMVPESQPVVVAAIPFIA